MIRTYEFEIAAAGAVGTTKQYFNFGSDDQARAAFRATVDQKPGIVGGSLYGPDGKCMVAIANDPEVAYGE